METKVKPKQKLQLWYPCCMDQLKKQTKKHKTIKSTNFLISLFHFCCIFVAVHSFWCDVFSYILFWSSGSCWRDTLFSATGVKQEWRRVFMSELRHHPSTEEAVDNSTYLALTMLSPLSPSQEIQQTTTLGLTWHPPDQGCLHLA